MSTSLLDGPALSPPDGVTSLLTRSAKIQILYFICVPVFTVISGILVILRIYTKLRIIRKFDITDALVVGGFILYVVDLIIGRYMVKYGIGVHQWDLPLKDYIEMLYFMNIAEIIYCPCLFMVKTAIVLQYLRIFAPTRSLNRLIWYGSYAVIASMFIFYTIDFFVTMFVCSPREKYWNDLVPGRCMNYNAIVVASAVFNILSDLCVLLLPLPTIWALHIPLKKKIAIFTLFGAGVVATAASGLRILYIINLANQGARADNSYNIALMGIWSWVEICLGISIACILPLLKLIREKGKKLLGVCSPIIKLASSFKSKFQLSSNKSHPGPQTMRSTWREIPDRNMPEDNLVFQTGNIMLMENRSEITTKKDFEDRVERAVR